MAKDNLVNPDGTFKGGFDGCVEHMQNQGYSAESAPKICGAIKQRVGASDASVQDNLSAEEASAVAKCMSDMNPAKAEKAHRDAMAANAKEASKRRGADAERFVEAAEYHRKESLIYRAML